jgi:anti-anti-sigma regulatory factor
MSEADGLVVNLVPTTTVVIQGRLDESNVGTLAAGIDRAAHAAELVVLDLDGVTAIDTAGLRAIAAARRAYGDRLELGRISVELAEVLTQHHVSAVCTRVAQRR